MSGDLEGSDLMALRNKIVASKIATAKLPTPKARLGAARKTEKNVMMAETDGRRKPAAERRETQMAFKVTADEKRRMQVLAKRHRVTMVEALVLAMEALESQMAKSEGEGEA